MVGQDHDFRNSARQSLKRAESELNSDDPMHFRYAALELRYAMEALTYDRARAYKNEIPPEEYGTWQPRKLMLLLAEINPHAVKSSTISARLEEEYGKPAPAKNMKLLGTDHVLSISDIKEHYDAIGSYLHIPSLKQIENHGVHDYGKLKLRCEKIILLLQTVLSSPIWNATFGNFATLPQCMDESCKKPVRKRIPIGTQFIDAECFECKAEYKIVIGTEDKVTWEPKQVEVHCSTPSCNRKFRLWPKELVPGTRWKCSVCGVRNEIGLWITESKKD